METNLLKQLDIIEGDTIYPVYIYDEGAHNKISGEITARSNADRQLQSNIDNEALARQQADTQLQGNIDNEALARQQADTQLQGNIDNEALARQQADNQLRNSITNIGIINVKDYGAVGDGTTNDYQAFVDAISATPIHGTLYIPMGTYKISDQLVITKPMRILGSYVGWDIYDANPDVPVDEMKKPLIISNSTEWAIDVRCLGFTIENISINAQGSGNFKGCLHLSNTVSTVEKFNRFNKISNCTFIRDASGGAGIKLEHTGLTTIERTLVYGFDIGYWLSQLDTTKKINTSVLISNCWAENYYATGYSLAECYYCVLMNCASDSTRDGVTGYSLYRCFGTQLVGCGAERNDNSFIIQSCIGCSLSGVSSATANTINDIKITGQSSVNINNFYATGISQQSNHKQLRVEAICYVTLFNTNINNMYYVDHDVTGIENGAAFASTSGLVTIS